ncbi:MAG: SDR family oxidoreductase [Chloroflexi bacterium]|nr:MAG: SDR family oxidoreductase [Chloroflexota bacterium]
MSLFDLSGKKALVTGGSRGLGFGMAQALLQAGADVAIVGLSDRVYRAAADLQAIGPCVLPLQADLSDRSQVQAMFDNAVEQLGGLDILLVNHGAQRRNPAVEFSLEDWDFIIEVNLSSMFMLNQLAGKIMLAQGKGKIINVASLLTITGGITVPAYAASKGGVGQLTKALSNEWAGHHINVNAIIPGYMATDMNEALINDPARSTMILNRIPAGRWGTPDDVKGVAVFLASSASDYVNGVLIPVDGGWLAR